MEANDVEYSLPVHQVIFNDAVRGNIAQYHLSLTLQSFNVGFLVQMTPIEILKKTWNTRIEKLSNNFFNLIM